VGDEVALAIAEDGPVAKVRREVHLLCVEASFMMMNQAMLMMPKAQMIDSRLIQDFKIKHQESNPRFKIQEKKSRSNKSRLHIG